MIYCVEDDSSIRELMLYTLQISGFEAKGFETRDAMPTQLARFDSQLILLDIMLPGMDGLGVLRTRHILRLQQGSCSIETGFVWTDLIHALERTSDHCSSIASGIIDLTNKDLNTHQMLRTARTGSDGFQKLCLEYRSKYVIN